MKFLIDQNLPVRLVDLLRDLGHDADHVKIVGLAQTDDREIWRLAGDGDAVVISKDRDFLAIARQGAGRQGLVHLDVGNCSNAILYEAVRQHWDAIVTNLTNGARVVELRL